jgi:hypothetical protein
VSSGWLQNLPSATSLKPAASTSRRSTASSMRCRLLPTVIRARLGGVVGDHQHAARLERREQLAIHFGTIDPHLGGVVIEEQERDDIEVAHVRRHRIVERPR